MKAKHSHTVHTLSHESNLINLLRWMKSNGYKSSKILRPAHFPITGRGMMAKCEIPENTCIISIPHNLLITTSVMLESWLGVFIRVWTSKLTAMEIITTFLVYEKYKRENSPWISYIDSLPTSYNVPSYWNPIPEEIPNRFKDSFLNQIRVIRRSYDDLKPLFKYIEDSMSDLKDAMTFAEFVWGWSTIQTRSVHFRNKEKIYDDPTDNFALAPFLDLFNHSPSAKVTAGFNYITQSYEIVTHQKILKHNQIFINYGELDNAKLILNYGFFVLRNPNSVVEFSLDEIWKSLQQIQLDNDCDSNFKTKINLLRNKNLLRNLNCTFEEPSWSLLICSRILVSNYQELQNWNRALEGPISLINETLSKKLIQATLKIRFNSTQAAIKSCEHLQRETWFSLIEEELNILNSCLNE